MSEMFCFQCQQTAGNSGCVRTGVCGKQPKTANLQDYLVCSLIHLAEIYAAKEDYPPEVTHLLADGLFATLTNVNLTIQPYRAISAAPKTDAPASADTGPELAMARRYGHRVSARHTAVRHEGYGSLCPSRFPPWAGG